MVRVDAEYRGGLRVVATHGPSGVELATDAPTDNEGRGESFSPTDLVGTALATCMLTIMGIEARKRGWALEGAQVSVEKEMAKDPRRIGRLVVDFSLPASLEVEARSELEKAAAGCPVTHTLHPDTRVEVTFSYS